MTKFPRYLRVGLLTCSAAYLLANFAHSATLESVTTESSDPGAAIASDQPDAPSPDAVQVALELLRLQEELGGSIVTDFTDQTLGQAPPWNAPPTTPTPPTRPHPHWTPQRPNPVEALRQTSWQLEQSAHLLESLDLYEQADAVRATAAVLRGDARKMKSRLKSTESAAASGK